MEIVGAERKDRPLNATKRSVEQIWLNDAPALADRSGRLASPLDSISDCRTVHAAIPSMLSLLLGPPHGILSCLRLPQGAIFARCSCMFSHDTARWLPLVPLIPTIPPPQSVSPHSLSLNDEQVLAGHSEEPRRKGEELSRQRSISPLASALYHFDTTYRI